MTALTVSDPVIMFIGGTMVKIIAKWYCHVVI